MPQSTEIKNKPKISNFKESENFLAPTSIAVIGASAEPTKIGYKILDNIISGGFLGKIYPINPHSDKILRHKAFKSVLDVPEDIDLAIIVIPAKAVPEVMNECAKKKIPTVVIISAGFREVGTEGKKLQKQITDIAKENHINIIGPNCLGFINPEINLNATFSATQAQPGNVVFFSQSGAFGTAVLDWANKINLGFKYFISIGNKATVNENVLLKMFIEQFKDSSENLVFAGYLEDFEDGKEFIELASELSKTHPIIIFKPGKSSKAQEAISSHTGSLATEDKVVDAALKQAGCIRTASIEEMFNTIQILVRQSIPRGNRVAVVTNAGGPGVVAIDQISSSKLVPSEFSETTKYALSQKLPEASNTKNPVDVLGDAQGDRFDMTLETLLVDENVDSVLVLLTPQAVTEVERTAGIICEKYRKYSNKPVIPCFIGGNIVKGGIDILNQYQMPIYEYPEEAIQSLENAYKYRRIQERIIPINNNTTAVKQLASDINILGKTAEELMQQYDIKVPPSIYLEPGDHIPETINSKLGFPVVAKIISPELVHKTELSAVKLNLNNESELKAAVDDLRAIWHRNFPYSNNFEIQIQKQIKVGENLIIGFKRDKNFGPVVLFGAGGILTELFQDSSQRIAPIDELTAQEMIDETKISQLLKGFRGSPKKDTHAIIHTIVQVAKLATEHKEIKEFDINPFIVLNQGENGFAVDIKIIT